MRSATESVIRAEELECQEDDMNVTDDTDQMKPDFPALSAVDAMVSFFLRQSCNHIQDLSQANC
jgi:hypothetical protein